MANCRPWRCYRKINRRPFQHKRSANHRREYARGGTQAKIQRFWGGNKMIAWEDWEVVVGLKVTERLQISGNALEAIRISVNGALDKHIGRQQYRFRVRPKPFQKFRENRMLAFAGADRVQSGMRNSFGRSTGVCARLKAGQIVVDVGVNMKNLNYVKDRLRVASMKIPCKCQIVLLKYKAPEFLKRAGIPLYDDKKRREISIFDLAAM